MNDLEALKRLQAADLALREAQAGLAGLPSAGKEIEANIAKMKALAGKVDQDLAKVQAEVKLKELEVSELAEKRGKLKDRLQKATTAKVADAVQAEMTSLEGRIAAAEEAQLEVMEREEEAQAMVQKVADGIARLEKQLADLEAKKPEKAAAFEEAKKAAEAEVEKFRAYLDEDQLERYDKLANDTRRKSKRWVVEVDTACAACDRTFTTEERKTLMVGHERPHTCPACRAIMIYAGAISL